MSCQLSVVLPTYNEANSSYLRDILSNLTQLKNTELIVVDGGSTDATIEIVTGFKVTLIQLGASSRAARLNKGIECAVGSLILLHHPRSFVAAEAIENLQTSMGKKSAFWGGFTHNFDVQHPLLKFTSWYSNKVRCDRRGIVYLDHCIFFDAEFKRQGLQIPDVEIFEDTELSKTLRTTSMPIRLPGVATTSAIRFTKNGVFRQAFMNQVLKLGYGLKVPARTMNKVYEKGLGLNS